jgi:hypothetical protein
MPIQHCHRRLRTLPAGICTLRRIIKYRLYRPEVQGAAKNTRPIIPCMKLSTTLAALGTVIHT